MLEDPDLPMATLMRALSNPTDLHNPDVVKVVTNMQQDAMYFSRSLVPFPEVTRPTWSMNISESSPCGTPSSPTLPPCPQRRLEQVERLEQLRALEHGYRVRVTCTQCADLPAEWIQCRYVRGSRPVGRVVGKTGHSLIVPSVYDGPRRAA